MRLLGEGGVPCSAILDTRDLYEDPHLLARDFIKQVEHPEMENAPLLGFAPRMSESSVDIERAPYLGEHTAEVLGQDLGLKSNEISRLHDQGVIG